MKLRDKVLIHVQIYCTFSRIILCQSISRVHKAVVATQQLSTLFSTYTILYKTMYML